jgi:hypothetical protein
MQLQNHTERNIFQRGGREGKVREQIHNIRTEYEVKALREAGEDILFVRFVAPAKRKCEGVARSCGGQQLRRPRSSFLM